MFELTAHSVEELVALGAVTVPAARFLEAAVVGGPNIIVVGHPGRELDNA